MKLPCEIVQDLLPLVEDAVCSELSRTAVAEHLQQCENCRKLAENTSSLPELALQPEQPAADKAVAKSLRKVRRRWVLSLLAVLLILPAALLGYLGYNQATGTGIGFTNIDEALTAGTFAGALASGDYEKAAGLLDFTRYYAEVLDTLAMSPEDYGAEFVEVRIGDELWMAEKSFAAEELEDASDARQTWNYLAYNAIFGTVIPEAVWNELIRTDPGMYEKGSDGTDMFAGYPYQRLETAWGVFMLPELSSEPIREDELPHFINSGIIAMCPKEMYRELEPEIGAIRQGFYEGNQSLYGYAAGLTPEEFAGLERSKYANALKELASEEFSVKNKGFQSAYRIEERCVTVYAVEVRCPWGSEVVHLNIECRGNAVISVSAHFSSDADWVSLFTSTVFMY